MEKDGTSRQATDGSIKQRKCLAFRITKARINTITIRNSYCSFPRQRWLRERGSVSHYSTMPILLVACPYALACSWLSVILLVTRSAVLILRESANDI